MTSEVNDKHSRIVITNRQRHCETFLSAFQSAIVLLQYSLTPLGLNITVRDEKAETSSSRVVASKLRFRLRSQFSAAQHSSATSRTPSCIRGLALAEM
jgi:hypothetical protein